MKKIMIILSLATTIVICSYSLLLQHIIILLNRQAHLTGISPQATNIPLRRKSIVFIQKERMAFSV